MTTETQFETLPVRDEIATGLVAVAMSGGVDSSTVAALLKATALHSIAAARSTMSTTRSASRNT